MGDIQVQFYNGQLPPLEALSLDDSECYDVAPYAIKPTASVLAGIPVRRSELPCSPEVTGPTLLLIHHKHDGTSLLTHTAVGAVVEAAEQYAAHEGGDWETSKVRIFSSIKVGDMPYGKNVKHADEWIGIAMRKIEPTEVRH